MATVTYTLSGDSVTFAFTPTTAAAAHTYEITYTSGALTGSTTVAGAGEPGPYYTTITGLQGGQAYNFDWTWVYYDDHDPVPVEQGRISVQTPDDTPKTATVSQWEDLATRVKAKANASSLSTVATSGSYNDLSNKPTVPTITMTNVDPGEGSALSADNYIAVYGGDPIILDYSTSEVNTGAKWIDGSPIYKKTVDTGALPNNGPKDVSHNISNLGTVINLEGYTTNGSVWLNLPVAAANPITVHATSTDIHITTTSDRSAYTTSYVTLYYTKSS